MRIRDELSIHGAFKLTSPSYSDSRGYFQEWFWTSECEFEVVQGNVSNSKAGVIRGLHVSIAPEGQAKWITCVAGSINDILLDLRPSSPTFLQTLSVNLGANSGISINIPPGVAHGFCSLEDETVVTYLVSAKYNSDHEVGIFPLDPELDINWGTSTPILSEKDANALTLSKFRARYEIDMGIYFGN